MMEAVPNYGSPLTYALPALTCIFSVLRDSPTGHKSYQGYQIMRISNISSNVMGFKILEELYNSDVLFDFMTRPSMKEPTDVMLCPEQVQNVKKIFAQFHIPYEIMVPDVETELNAELKANNLILRKSEGMNWNAYQRLSTIHGWMDSMAEKYPALVSVETYGLSTEGRPMKLMKITTGGTRTKPAVWLDGGIHAREWISPATVTYIANELIQQAIRGGPEYRLVNAVDWFIVPNINPDGYEYSHTNDRLWRKTRSNDGSFMANVFGCLGTDPNRNWEYKWGGKGTSKNPCSSQYHGPKAASEPEISLSQAYILERKDQLKLVLTFHSYSQMIFTPWGYDYVPLEDKEELENVGRQAAKALEAVHGTKYQVGASPDLLYPAAGGTEDFAKGVAGIKFAYCYELRDTGKHGFNLPPDQIIPTGEETFASVKAIVEGVMSYHQVDGF
ncbi:carboxypeptidase B [Folsomia candida]|nr:carboxypeptidase B [Folsomia candida]